MGRRRTGSAANKKCNLPGEGNAHESIVETRVGDGRRVLLPDSVREKVQRGDDHKAVNTGDPENNFGEFHVLRASAAGC